MIKKRVISMLLSMLMLLTCFCVQSPTEVSAAKKQTVKKLTADSIIVERGKKFYVGDYVTVWMENYYTSTLYASMVEASYESNNPEVIKVEENGYATTKELGDAVVKISYQGQSAEFNITVVKKGTLSAGKEETVEKWEAAGKKLAKKLPSTLTVNNGYTFIKALKIYLKAFSDCTDFEIMRYIRGRDTYRSEYEAYAVLSPICQCYDRALSMMEVYINQYFPAVSNKISANENKITINFKKKIGSKELLALYLKEAFYQITNDEADTPLKIDIKIQKNRLETRVYLSAMDKHGNRMDNSEDIVATAIFKKGSKTITIKPTAVRKCANGKWKDVKKSNLKFVKGRSYVMWSGLLFGDGEYSGADVTIK